MCYKCLLSVAIATGPKPPYSPSGGEIFAFVLLGMIVVGSIILFVVLQDKHKKGELQAWYRPRQARFLTWYRRQRETLSNCCRRQRRQRVPQAPQPVVCYYTAFFNDVICRIVHVHAPCVSLILRILLYREMPDSIAD